MVKSFLKLLAVLVVGIILYNLILGTDEEKKGAQKIVGEMKDVAVSVKDLLKSEKEKFDKGKYDKAIDKIGNMLSKLKENAKEFDKKYLKQIDELEKRRKELKEELDRIDGSSDSGDTNAVKEDSKKLLQEIESLMKELDESK